MKATITFDKDKYIARFVTDINGEYEVDDDFDLHYMTCYYLKNKEIVLDEEKKAKQIKQEEEEDGKPTWQDSIDSQVFYTAMITDTLIEE